MKLDHPKDLDSLREQCSRLSDQLGRRTFVWATLFVIFVFSLASAFQSAGSKNPSGIARAIEELVPTSGRLPEIDGFLNTLYFPHYHEGRVPDDVTLRKDVRAAERDSAEHQQDSLAAELTKITDSAFTLSFKAPLLGTEIKIDLRLWVFILPLCFLAWEVDLAIQRHKLRTLQNLAGLAARQTSQPGVAGTAYDFLAFGDGKGRLGPFLRHPGQFEQVIIAVAGAALIAYLCRQGWSFLKGAEGASEIIEVYCVPFIYAIAYAGFVKRRINRDASQVDGFVPAAGWPSRWFGALGSRLRWIGRWLWPEVHWTLGSAMVIATLWLLVGAPLGCEPVTGLEYLRKPGGWLVGPITGIGAGGGWHGILIALLYAIGLLAAATTIVLMLVSLAKRKRTGGSVALVLAALTTGLALFFLTELSFGLLIDIGWYTVPLALLWLVPMWKWWSDTRDGSNRARWPAGKSSLARWYVPQVMMACVITTGTLFEKYCLIGVPVFVLGLGFLSIGYWLAHERSPVRGRS